MLPFPEKLFSLFLPDSAIFEVWEKQKEMEE